MAGRQAPRLASLPTEKSPLDPGKATQFTRDYLTQLSRGSLDKKDIHQRLGESRHYLRRERSRPGVSLIVAADCFREHVTNVYHWAESRAVILATCPTHAVHERRRITRTELSDAMTDYQEARRLYYTLMQELDAQKKANYLQMETITFYLPPADTFLDKIADAAQGEMATQFTLTFYTLIEDFLETCLLQGKPIANVATMRTMDLSASRKQVRRVHTDPTLTRPFLHSRRASENAPRRLHDSDDSTTSGSACSSAETTPSSSPRSIDVKGDDEETDAELVLEPPPPPQLLEETHPPRLRTRKTSPRTQWPMQTEPILEESPMDAAALNAFFGEGHVLQSAVHENRPHSPHSRGEMTDTLMI